jgi:Rrf2 family transcriptional regulator, cysteine metabolism repressor
MKLSTRARYALRMMLDVARSGGEGRPVSLTAVARRQGLSRGYLEQVALPLHASGLLIGVPGRKGGYRLGRPADEITVGNIVQSMIGSISIVPCVGDQDVCSRSGDCECRLLWTLINLRIVEVLEHYTLAELLDPSFRRSVSHAIDELTALPTRRRGKRQDVTHAH